MTNSFNCWFFKLSVYYWHRCTYQSLYGCVRVLERAVKSGLIDDRHTDYVGQTGRILSIIKTFHLDEIILADAGK